MKLRCKGNSLRLRIARSELAKLMAGEPVVEQVQFGSSVCLGYRLEVTPVAEAPAVSVNFDSSDIMIVIAAAALATWSADDQVGIYTTVPNGCDEGLQVILEKDFECLDSSDEENADAFQHPRAAAAC